VVGVAITSGNRDFVVAYEGRAVDDGRMPVRDLAPSLMALAELTQEANSALPTGGSGVQLDIRTFDKASFDVGLILTTGVALFSSDPATAAANIITLTTTALGLLRDIHGRPILGRAPLAENRTRIILPGIEIETQSEASDLVEQERFRFNARSFIRPLRQPGIERIRIVVEGRPRLEVGREDVDAFQEPAVRSGTLIHRSDIELSLTIAAPSFIRGNKWRLYDGSHTDWYDMQDEAFLERVQQGQVAFRAADTLVCRVRLEQWRSPFGEPHLERVIEAVLEHVPSEGAPLSSDALFGDDDEAN
jgi:hypothetical protein